MFVGRVQAEGLRGIDHLVVDASRMAQLPGGAAGAGLADALDLLAMAMHPGRAVETLGRLGWTTSDTSVFGEGEGFEVQQLFAPAVADLLAPGARALTVEAALTLDPPLYGRLRAMAAREPRLVAALGHSPTMTVKAGLLFTRDRRVVHPSVLNFRIGDVGFDASGRDRPAWLPELLADIGARFHRTDAFEPPGGVARRMVGATLSPDASVREGLRRAKAAVTRPPFGLDEPSVAEAEGRVALVFGPDLVPARQLGRDAIDAVRWAEAAFVRRPDVLVVDEPPPGPAVRDWWASLVESGDAPVEQVWLR